VLREAEAGATTKDLCRKYGLSEPTFYNWKTKYAGMAVSETRRLKARGRELEAEEAAGRIGVGQIDLEGSAGSKCMVRLVVARAKQHRRRQVALMYPASCRRDVVTPRPTCIFAHAVPK
jgi:putative transposase